MSEEIATRDRYAASRRWVVKIGSSLVTADGRGLDHDIIAAWVDQLAGLHRQGKQVVLVSSGAVAAGMNVLGWQTRPAALQQLQAAAAVGQMRLVQAYETCFQGYGLHTAQVLLTSADLTDRIRYLNARGTLRTLLELGAVPVVNENDVVSNEELRFGDNDTLASLVTNLVEADVMAILTDQAGLYEDDPRKDPTARLIPEGRAEDPELQRLARPGSGELGRGGMATKLAAAERAARSGAATVIADGRERGILLRLARGETVGTSLTPSREPLAARKQWINSHLRARGTLHLDDGAARVLRESGGSLLPVGVSAVEGRFAKGDVVVCRDPQGREVARGFANYAADDCDRIKGEASQRIAEVLGYIAEPELIHRDDMVVSAP